MGRGSGAVVCARGREDCRAREERSDGRKRE